MADDVKVNSAAIQTIYQQTTQISSFSIEAIAYDSAYVAPPDLEVFAVETQVVLAPAAQVSSFSIEAIGESQQGSPLDLFVKATETQVVLSNSTLNVDNFSIEAVSYGFIPPHILDFSVEIIAERVYLPTAAEFSIEAIADNTNALPTDTTAGIFWSTPGQ
jgi:hypothetical protein